MQSEFFFFFYLLSQKGLEIWWKWLFTCLPGLRLGVLAASPQGPQPSQVVLPDRKMPLSRVLESGLFAPGISENPVGLWPSRTGFQGNTTLSLADITLTLGRSHVKRLVKAEIPVTLKGL